MTSRREFLERSTFSALGLAVPPFVLGPVARTMAAEPSTFLDLLRPPGRVVVQGANGDQVLNRTAEQMGAAPMASGSPPESGATPHVSAVVAIGRGSGACISAGTATSPAPA